MHFSMVLERVTKQCGQVANYRLRSHRIFSFNFVVVVSKDMSAQFYMCYTKRDWLPSTVMIFGVNFYEYRDVAFCVFSALLTSSNFSTFSIFPGGVVPYDGVPTEKEVSVDPSLTVIFSILATAGITFGVVCLVFNFIFREKK